MNWFSRMKKVEQEVVAEVEAVKAELRATLVKHPLAAQLQATLAKAVESGLVGHPVALTILEYVETQLVVAQ